MTKTTAEKISEKFSNDGQCFTNAAGEELDDVCEAHTRPDYRDGYGTDTYRYTFDDGSVITIAGDGWDLGYPGCYCWQGVGHDDCDVVDSLEAI